MLGAFRTTSIAAMQYGANLETPIDHLNHTVALAAVRTLYLPLRNPVRHRVASAQVRHRVNHKTPLDYLFADGQLPFPPIASVQPIDIPAYRLWYNPQHITSVAESPEKSIEEHDAIVATADPRSIVYTDEIGRAHV